ncbi:hypothetical protein NE236_08960 [Actinoallomurus purpureus]|uniref:hypothetical protein n=1 Tax=Actinoallomurus purpureus TaxID=478114 RepID=UPI00209352DF|nr:hypothetical protein [Actinoallomurus purpureus]MCO6005112.1 hypothetical protein [Actinoallomurus purpureus]
MSGSAHEDNTTLPALRRHFEDLRDGVHGGVVTRERKEERFAGTVVLLRPHARRVLEEVDRDLLRGTGDIDESGLTRTADGGLTASWTLSWPEQRAAGVRPITLEAHFERSFHHPHLRGATVGEWPLNVFDDEQAAAEVPTLRAIAAADLHSLVFQRDYRLVPAITRPDPGSGG